MNAPVRRESPFLVVVVAHRTVVHRAPSGLQKIVSNPIHPTIGSDESSIKKIRNFVHYRIATRQ